MHDSTAPAKLPIVFLHAYPVDATLWDPERARLADRTTLAPNLPGFGGRPPEGRSLDDFARTVVDDMDAAGIGRAVIVGLSMGGYVAFRLHARWKDRVAALVLADTRAGPDTVEAAAKRTQQAARARVEGLGWLPDAFLPTVLTEKSRRDRPEIASAIRAMIGRADPEGVARALEAMRDRPDSTSELARIDVPVLAVVGDADTLTPLSEAERIARGVADGRIEVIREAGHLSNLENSHAFAEALDGFLTGVEAGVR